VTTWFNGDIYSIKLTGLQTGGQIGLVEATVPPGGGPAPHVRERTGETSSMSPQPGVQVQPWAPERIDEHMLALLSTYDAGLPPSSRDRFPVSNGSPLRSSRDLRG
jgi:hypothetical protein